MFGWVQCTLYVLFKSKVDEFSLCQGDLPPAKDLGRLINLNNVRNSIESPVTEAQKDEIKKDLEAAVSEFTAREEEAFNASHSNPFVTVNNQTNFVATHSRLLHALQLSIDQSVARLGIPPHSGAFDEVSRIIFMI